MSAAHVRRGSGSGRKRGKPARGKVTVPRKLVDKLPVQQDSANRLARWAFGLFAAAAVAVTLVALDIPAKAGLAAGEAIGDAGFRVRSVDVQGVHRMDRKPVYQIALDQKSMAMPLVDVAAIRERLLQYGWVKDARVSRRLPDTLVIDIIERKPTAIWQDSSKLSLIDAEGVVLDRVPISAMPDLPLLIGPGANAQSRNLQALLQGAPTLGPQLESATWVGRRRWDLNFQSGETVALPEGQADAKAALAKFAKLDKSAGLLGRGILRIDLRIPGKMVVRLPRAPGEPIVPETKNQS
ncbi:cell division protein FtsQ/DivIB [Sphingomonas alba]|uniref:Cell division protein FtsQ n=1 Tax=Sphingomonas alba TaxID=2908208 RepID=A0ABT0RL20_9SPHN|nr:cell division protein FtsQ/DivIB [Sphingomonas alba]MCL6683344.1 cell division protein FtsQ/DivIB [Sphingomonas alba]